MNLPGFTAEASLYESRANYQVSGVNVQHEDAVRPAQISTFVPFQAGHLPPFPDWFMPVPPPGCLSWRCRWEVNRYGFVQLNCWC